MFMKCWPPAIRYLLSKRDDMKTKTIRFPYYRDTPSVEIPEKNLIGVFAPKNIDTEKPVTEIIRSGIENPIQSPRLSSLAQSGARVLILVDDNTRTTPVKEILPALSTELKKGGVAPEHIELLVALGTHRPMSPAEQEKKFGRRICEAHPIHMHQWNNPAELHNLGTTASGTVIEVNKRLLDADLIIGVGQIVPHRVAGYSGGSKIVQPGVCGAVTTGQTHWLSAQFRGEAIMGKVDNPVRSEMDQVAQQVNLHFIANAVMDLSDSIVALVCGEPSAAFGKGASLSRDIFGVHIPEKGDIVITDSYPADLEMWQASKGIYAADLAVKPGGVIVMISPCTEGVSAEHPDVLKYGYLTSSEVRERVQAGEIPDLTLAAHLIHVGQVIQEKATAILVSPGISAADSRKLGFLSAENLQTALKEAIKLTDPKPAILVLQHAGHILPLTG
jgi:nickel-dependent lactate racemase